MVVGVSFICTMSPLPPCVLASSFTSSRCCAPPPSINSLCKLDCFTKLSYVVASESNAFNLIIAIFKQRSFAAAAVVQAVVAIVASSPANFLQAWDRGEICWLIVRFLLSFLFCADGLSLLLLSGVTETCLWSATEIWSRKGWLCAASGKI